MFFSCPSTIKCYVFLDTPSQGFKLLSAGHLGLHVADFFSENKVHSLW